MLWRPFPRFRSRAHRKPSRGGKFPDVVGLCLALFVIGCGGNEEPPPGIDSAPPSVPQGESCEGEEQRRCSSTVSQENGTLLCAHGVQTCNGNTWGPCENAVLRKEVDMRLFDLDRSETRKPLALSSAVDCEFNPCDPSCQVFIENPEDLTAMGGASGMATTFGGDPPDWSSGSSLAPCAHDLCVEGGSLDSACHPCVANVCALDASCCSDTGGSTWDSDCVGLVHTECADQPAQPPLPAVTACDFSVFGEERLRFVNAGTYLGGPLGSNATGTSPAVEVSGGATVPSILTDGDVLIGGGSTVTGNVAAEGSITNSGTVDGMENASVTFPTVAIPTRTVDCLSADATTTTLAGQTISDGDTRVIVPAATGTPSYTFSAPGRFGGFQANGNDARLVFSQSGTYTFAQFHLNSGSDFTVEVPVDGTVIIEICGPADPIYYATAQVELAGAIDLLTSNATFPRPHQVQIYTNFAGNIPITAAALQGMTLIAPYGRVYSTGSPGSSTGMVLARQVDFVTEIHLSSVGFSGVACEEAGILGPDATCPISLAIGSMPPTRRDGCLSGEDCQANSRCTDVNTAPSCGHSKCIAGGPLDTACQAADSCVARICEVEGSCCNETTGWSCLPGNLCVAAACGDGMVRGLELCDDGDASAGDGCGADCRVESGYVCSGEPSVCRPTVCGDGIIEGDEGCDDGALSPWDGCSETCDLEPMCPPAGGACSSQCGDGMILAGDAEQCDDGNQVDGDGCSSSCLAETGFACAPQTAATEPFIDLPVVYRDFASQGTNQHPDFQAFRGVYPTRGMVQSSLGADGLPVYAGICEVPNAIALTECPNIGVWDGYATATGYMTTSQAAFDQWYRPSSTSNAYWDTIRLDKNATAYEFTPGNAFYPLTGAPLASGDSLLWASIGSLENFSFTSEVRHWFEYGGGEVLDFQGDDDVWVFINGRLVLDLGGLHKALAGRVTLSGTDAVEEWWDDDGYHTQTHAIGLVLGSAYEIALFHAERAAWESNFSLTLSGFFREPSVCTPICGDGLVVSGEVCDDGTNDGGSGECAPGCQGWDDTGVPPQTWSSVCIDLVKTVCDADCGATVAGNCSHGACEVGAALDASCSPCIADVCDLTGLAYCCDTTAGAWDSACMTAANEVCANEGGRACDYAVLSNGTTHVSGTTVSGGLVGGSFVEIASGASTGDILASGSVSIQGGTTGAVQAAGSISQTGGSTGSQNPYQDIPSFPITTKSFSCGGTSTTSVASGSPQSLMPATYPNIVVQDGGVLTFNGAGDYYISSLTVQGTGKLVMPTSGNVNVHICGELIFQGAPPPSTVGPTMELSGGATPSQADALRFRFHVNGSGGSVITNEATFWGMVFLPQSGISIGSGATLNGLVHANGAISTSAGATINSSSVTGAACVSTEIVASVEAPTLTECSYAMVGSGSMVVVGGTVLGGDVSGGGAVAAQPISGTCEPPTSGICSYSPSIEENVHVAGAFAGCSYVGGDCNSNLGGSLALPTIATRSFSCSGTTSITLNTGDPFPPGQYDSVTVAAGQTVSFQEGTYRVNDLSVSDGATIALPTAGTVNVDSCGRIHIGENVTTTGITSSADGLRLQLYSQSTDHTPLPGTRTDNAIYVGKSSTVYATLVAPAGAVLVDDWADVYGFIHAREGMVLSGAVLDATGVTGASCEVNPQFGQCLADDIETPSIFGGGICIENGMNHVDPTCAGVDLAVDFGCNEYLPVCNHGTVDAPAGVELTFFPRAGHQLGTETPDEAWAIGTCTVSDPIPSGTCVSQACDPALVGQEATVMVNLHQAVAECSYLDNWSLVDPAELCPSDYEPLVFTEVYEARCPSGSRPTWGFLTWNTQTPGSSSVTFDGRIAGTSSALSSEPFVQVGRAAQTPINTQTCAYVSGLASCPVDLLAFLQEEPDSFENVTDGVTGARETASFLELRFTLTPSLADAPILEDWNITHSCLFDQ